MPSSKLQSESLNLPAASIKGCCGNIVPQALTEEQAQQYANWFKVLADPTRLRILNLLARNSRPLCVCDIVEQFDLGQPTISHHLKILKESCFVSTERVGAFVYYSINIDCLTAIPGAANLIMNTIHP